VPNPRRWDLMIATGSRDCAEKEQRSFLRSCRVWISTDVFGEFNGFPNDWAGQVVVYEQPPLRRHAVSPAVRDRPARRGRQVVESLPILAQFPSVPVDCADDPCRRFWSARSDESDSRRIELPQGIGVAEIGCRGIAEEIEGPISSGPAPQTTPHQPEPPTSVVGPRFRN